MIRLKMVCDMYLTLICSRRSLKIIFTKFLIFLKNNIGLSNKFLFYLHLQPSKRIKKQARTKICLGIYRPIIKSKGLFPQQEKKIHYYKKKRFERNRKHIAVYITYKSMHNAKTCCKIYHIKLINLGIEKEKYK